MCAGGGPEQVVGFEENAHEAIAALGGRFAEVGGEEDGPAFVKPVQEHRNGIPVRRPGLYGAHISVGFDCSAQLLGERGDDIGKCHFSFLTLILLRHTGNGPVIKWLYLPCSIALFFSCRVV